MLQGMLGALNDWRMQAGAFGKGLRMSIRNNWVLDLYSSRSRHARTLAYFSFVGGNADDCNGESDLIRCGKAEKC